MTIDDVACEKRGSRSRRSTAAGEGVSSFHFLHVEYDLPAAMQNDQPPYADRCRFPGECTSELVRYQSLITHCITQIRLQQLHCAKSAFSRARRYWQRAEDPQKGADIFVALRYNVESCKGRLWSGLWRYSDTSVFPLLEFISNFSFRGQTTIAG